MHPVGHIGTYIRENLRTIQYNGHPIRYVMTGVHRPIRIKFPETQLLLYVINTLHHGS